MIFYLYYLYFTIYIYKMTWILGAHTLTLVFAFMTNF